MPLLTPPDAKGVAVAAHLAVEADQVIDPGAGDGGPEARRLRDRGRHAVAAEAVAHHPQALRIGDSQLHDPIHPGHHGVDKIAGDATRMHWRVGQQHGVTPGRQELQVLNEGRRPEPVDLPRQVRPAIDMHDQRVAPPLPIVGRQ